MLVKLIYGRRGRGEGRGWGVRALGCEVGCEEGCEVYGFRRGMGRSMDRGWHMCSSQQVHICLMQTVTALYACVSGGLSMCGRKRYERCKSFESVGEREGNREVKGREVIEGQRVGEGGRQQNEEGKKRGRVLLFLSVLVMHA